MIFLILVILVFLLPNYSNAQKKDKSTKLNINELDSEYSKEFTDLIELVYGSEFLSQGGNESVNKMFEKENLNNKKLLDVGSGLGGVEFYLAQKFNVDITGIDRVKRLIVDSNKRKNNFKLIGKVRFIHQKNDTDLTKFENNTFDIVFSKESLLHVADKLSLLKEIYRVLKPNGKLIILDWLMKDHNLGHNIKEMMEMDGLDLKMSTPEEYTNMLKQIGFENIEITNLNNKYIQYTQDNIDIIKLKKNEIIKLADKNTFNYALKTWNVQKKIFENNEVLITLLRANKE